ncbi:MAG TPA: hypothetical protein VGE52_01235, partial [Pirellulales bacterium]
MTGSAAALPCPEGASPDDAPIDWSPRLMAKKKKHAPPPPPGHPRGKKKKAAPRLVVDPALLEQAVARIKATRLGLGPHDRKHLGRDLGKRYVLEHSEGYQLKNILEAD